MSTFSDRHGYAPAEKDLATREVASVDFRNGLISLAYDCGSRPHEVRETLCRLLWKTPNPSNWSAFPNVDFESRELLEDCEWFEVYDFTEAIYPHLENKAQFEAHLNKYFRRNGIGWKFEDGQIQVRGEDAFERSVDDARTALSAGGQVTAARELREALADLSRRPEPDITGAIQHALAALECTARDTTGDPKATLGDLIKRYPEMLKPPLDVAVSKLWGFASEYGRHIREGRIPLHEDAELAVHVASAVASYLSKKVQAEGSAP